MSDLVWTRRMGATMAYYTAETPIGRVRVSRVSKTGQPAFRAYFPDGKHNTQATVAEAQDAAAAYVNRKTGAPDGNA